MEAILHEERKCPIRKLDDNDDFMNVKFQGECENLTEGLNGIWHEYSIDGKYSNSFVENNYDDSYSVGYDRSDDGNPLSLPPEHPPKVSIMWHSNIPNNGERIPLVSLLIMVKYNILCMNNDE